MMEERRQGVEPSTQEPIRRQNPVSCSAVSLTSLILLGAGPIYLLLQSLRSVAQARSHLFQFDLDFVHLGVAWSRDHNLSPCYCFIF